MTLPLFDKAPGTVSHTFTHPSGIFKPVQVSLTVDPKAAVDMPHGAFAREVRKHRDPLWGLLKDHPRSFVHNPDAMAWVAQMTPLAAAQLAAEIPVYDRATLIRNLENGWDDGDGLEDHNLANPEVWLDAFHAHLTELT